MTKTPNGVTPVRTLADVNVWIATLHEAHPHHAAAVAWWRDTVIPSNATVAFCRITQLGLLRLLSNERVMGPSILKPDRAWATYRQLLEQPPVDFADEPAGTEDAFAALTAGQGPSTGIWTDAYLAGFARAGGFAIASFDRGFRRFPGLDLELLSP